MCIASCILSLHAFCILPCTIVNDKINHPRSFPLSTISIVIYRLNAAALSMCCAFPVIDILFLVLELNLNNFLGIYKLAIFFSITCFSISFYLRN